MSDFIIFILAFCAGGMFPWGIIIGRATSKAQNKVMAELTSLADKIDGKTS